MYQLSKFFTEKEAKAFVKGLEIAGFLESEIRIEEEVHYTACEKTIYKMFIVEVPSLDLLPTD